MNDLTNDPVGWGRKLIESNDHDPLYTALWRYAQAKGRTSTAWRRIDRFCVAYWCCYNVGASWRLSAQQGATFWSWLHVAALNKVGPHAFNLCATERWPRAHERRHWRGDKAVKSVLWLRERYPNPEAMIAELMDLPTLEEIQKKVSEWPQFGPWIGFKIADMVERVYGQSVAFPLSIVSLYKDPREGAEMMAEHLNKAVEYLNGDAMFDANSVVTYLLRAYQDIKAPPSGNREVNIQEVETVLCKWKSARKGHYRLGMDTADHRASLEEWKGNDLLELYPTVPAF